VSVIFLNKDSFWLERGFNMSNEYLGQHLMLDLAECNVDTLVDEVKLRGFLDDLPDRIGMKKISEPKVLKYLDKWAETPGLTGFVVLAESHMSFHTFPDARYAFVDIFSCGAFDVKKTKQYIIDFFASKKPAVHLVNRGESFDRKARMAEALVRQSAGKL
jgi:S-adenosylmethionine decarboxylase